MMEQNIDKLGKENKLNVESNDLEYLLQSLPEKIVDKKSNQAYELSMYKYYERCYVDYVGELDHASLLQNHDFLFGENTYYEAAKKALAWIEEIKGKKEDYDIIWVNFFWR